MSVYVDDMFIERRGNLWCHLVADSYSELVQFAAKIGLRPAWIHNNDHYDVTEYMRIRAIKLGAIPVTPQEAVIIRKAISN